jgi:hypothetical protein
MKLKLFILACGIVMSLHQTQVYSQILKQTIRGQVIDIDSKMPLIGVTLFIEGSTPVVGTVSDPEGYFTFPQIPVGRYNIVVDYIGYETKVIPNLLIGAGKEAIVNIELTESLIKLDEVTVTARKNKGEPLNDMATVSARSFTVEETQRYAGSFADPSRMVSSYAGVIGDPNGNNSIIIRGNSPRGLLWRVEGIDVPNPNHFANEGSTGGPISILNGTTLSNSDFMTGAFPAGYGDAYSGVFDIKLRNGNNEKHEYTVQAGVIGMEVAAEGPFSSDNTASYLVNYRYSSLALLNQVGIKVAGDAIPKFQDLTLNVNIPTQRFGTFKIFGIGGISTISESEPSYKQTYNMTMGVFGINHILPLSEKTYFKSSLSSSCSLGEWNYKEADNETNIMELRGQEGLDYINHRGAMEISHKFSAKNSIRIGGSVYSKNYNLLIDMYNFDRETLENTLDDEGGTELFQSYIAWKFRPFEKLTVNSGIHYTYLNLNGNKSVEPRVGVRWQLSPRYAVIAGFGQHSKMENVSLYLSKVFEDDNSYTLPNKGLDFIRANHYVIGYDWRVSQNLNLKVEAYYQDLYNVPVEDDISSSFSILNSSDGYIFIPLVNKGSGRNYGTEITFEKFFSKNYYFLVTTSLYESKFTAMDGIERNSVFNNNYVFNVVGGKEIPIGKNKNNALSINLRGTFAGGQYYSPIDPVESAQKGYTVRPDATAFSKKRPEYLRADIKLSYRKNKKQTTRVLELDIQNVTNTLNVTGDYWNDDEQKVEEWTQLGLLPVLSYRIEF